MGAADIGSVLVAAGDACSDVAFTAQRLGTMSTAADQVAAFLLLLFLLLPTAASASQLFVVMRSKLLDSTRMKEMAAFYAFMMLVSLTNMELLRFLPWRQGDLHDGLPDRKLMLRIFLAVMLLEDLPQLAIQASIIATGGTYSLLGPLSIAFSVASIVWRGLRKSIYFMPSNQVESRPVVSVASDSDHAPEVELTGAQPVAARDAAEEQLRQLLSSSPQSVDLAGLRRSIEVAFEAGAAAKLIQQAETLARRAEERASALGPAVPSSEEAPALTATASPLVGRQVEISGLSSRPELNQQVGTAESFNEETGRAWPPA